MTTTPEAARLEAASTAAMANIEAVKAHIGGLKVLLGDDHPAVDAAKGVLAAARLTYAEIHGLARLF